jgi:conjugal transfer pilus assembly protein TraD
MSFEFQTKVRPNVEKYAALGWVIGTAGLATMPEFTTLPTLPFYAAATIMGLAASWRTSQAVRYGRWKQSLGGTGIEFITFEELKRKARPDAMYIGRGFPWGPDEAQYAYDMLKTDIPTFVGGTLGRGAGWLHAAKKKHEDIYLHDSMTKGHTLIMGTTGAGKTRLYDLLTAQMIMRGGPLIMIDPKGDKELREGMRRACNAVGRPEAFVEFNPAFPERSVKWNPLATYNRSTEVGDRIAKLIATEDPNDPFTAYSRMTVNQVVNGLLHAGEPVTLARIYTALQRGIAPILVDAITLYGALNGNKASKPIDQLTWEEMREKARVNAMKDRRAGTTQEQRDEKFAKAMIALYREKLPGNSELDGVITLLEKNREHFGKMIASLLPVLESLTAGPLAELMSPEPDPLGSDAVITDTEELIKNDRVVYIGLDSLSDGAVGTAIGSILLADITAMAGQRYNYEPEGKPVNVVIDEAAEIVNEPTIQLLNKGRGAGFRLVLATQTLSDLEARLANKAKAGQVLGNLNNTIILRVPDPDTQEHLIKGIPKTSVSYVMRTQGTTTSPTAVTAHGGNVGERLMYEEADMLSPGLLGQMPDLEGMAKMASGELVKIKFQVMVEDTKRQKSKARGPK